MANAGYKAEQRVIDAVAKAGKAVFKKTDNSVVEIPVNDKMYVFGFSTKTKVDLVIGTYRLQIKATGTKRAAVVNMVPVRLLEKVSKEQLLDVEQCFTAMEIISNSPKSKIKLSEHFELSDWQELLEYFIFEGTATGQADPHMQATHLLEVDGDDFTIIDKQEAVNHIWKGLEAEIRFRPKKDEPCLHIRYKA